MDEADIAQRNQEQFQRLALQAHQDAMPRGESATECENCGEPIPEKRRRAMPGCIRCIACQQLYERRNR